MGHTCKHGDRTNRQGQGPKGMWYAAFCSQPKGSPDQCEPLWLDANGNVKTGSPAKAAAQQANSEQTAILREMNNTLIMMFAWMKLRFPSAEPNLNHVKPVPMPAQPEMPPMHMPGDEPVDLADIPF